MDLLRFLESEPKRFSLPLAIAIGMALGFYPGPAFLIPALVLALALAALGNVMADSRGSAPRLRRIQALAASMGIVTGAAIAWYEAGAAPNRPVASEVGIEAERRLIRLDVAWAEGRLAADSTPARNGFRSYSIAVGRLGLEGGGATAELTYPRKGSGEAVRVLVRAGPEIDAGSLIRARGSMMGAALFAQPNGILLIDRGGPVERARSAARSAFRKALTRIGKRSAGLMQALILGARDSLAPGEAEAFKAAGCAHILALSGEHLSVLAVLAIAALRPLFGPTRAKLGGALLATLFMWIAGPGPSLVRAVLMVWFGAIALALDRPQPWLNSLALAYIVTLPIDPAGARSLGFTLSYAAVWGLAVLGPRFSFLLGRALPPFLREAASASLAAQAAVSPLLAFSFGYLQFAGILASMAAGPVVTIIMWWGMGAGLLCSLMPFAAPVAVPISELLYRTLMGIMNAAAAVPPLPLPCLAASAAASAAVVALAALVYARPHAEYRASGRGAVPSRLRFAPGSSGPPRGRGLGAEQALRPELPGQ